MGASHSSSPMRSPDFFSRSANPMAELWNERIERMPREEMRALQLERLKRQVAYNYAGSAFYQEKMDGARIKPEDIRSFEDFAHVPLMDKDEHRKVQERSLGRRRSSPRPRSAST